MPVLAIVLAVGSWGVAVWRSGVLDAELGAYGEGVTLLCREGLPLRIQLGADEQDARPVDYASMSPWVVKALIAAEDKRFLRHAGVDPLAILRAVGQNLWFRRRISGASTLSTQVIRMAEPRSRTAETKAIEAAKALYMERFLDKQAVLEQYLNRAPFGGNLVGIEAASRMYFDKSAADLTLAEAALLAGLPQSPSRLRPDRHPAAARARMEYVLERMQANGFITAAQHAEAMRQPLGVRRHARPFLAPHFADFVLGQNPDGRGALATTLDRDLQQRVERVFNRHVPGLREQQVGNGAVVVLDVETGAVLAMIGSFDYHDTRHAGMVNHALAARSPGSALKPLIYAMALEQGMITPGYMLDDSPLRFRDGAPANFDKTFQGNVSVRDALIRSLNIPALRVMHQVGLQEAVDGLQRLGLNTLDRRAADYGLGLAIGGCEVTLLELANAYACLAREGVYLPYRLHAEDVSGADAGRRLFSAEAAFMVADMLGGEERSMDVFGHVADARLPRFAWKTGTSSGFRDAWTIAWNPRYVIGVWLGHSDGSGRPALVGAQVAAPLAGDILRTLFEGGASPWYQVPEGLAVRRGSDGMPEWHMPGISVPVQQALAGVMPLRIVTPVNGTVYQIVADERLQQSIVLQAEGMGSRETLHWFVNGGFLGTTHGGQTLEWVLRAGAQTLVCVADGGQRAETQISIRAAAL
jgi:penicillin-binding protein 1C